MKKLLCTVLSVLLILSFCISCDINELNIKNPINNTSESYFNGLTIHFLDVGQGSSILIEDSDEYMLIDGGDRDYSSFVVSYLQNQGVDELEYVIATHYDADHLNGVVGVLNTFEVDTVLCPNYSTDSRVYKSFVDIIKEKDINKEYPSVGDNYEFGDADFMVICPNIYGSDSNNNSVGIKFKYGETSAIFCGDVEIESEKNMLDSRINLKADIYYVNHHGSDSSSSDEFVKAISPKYAVISCGKNNSYGHPDEKTISTLEKYGCEILRTDLQGTIICEMDGNNISWSCENNFDENNSSSLVCDYVVNESTKKFHLLTCSSCDDIKDKHKAYKTSTHEEMVALGYSPCNKCDP